MPEHDITRETRHPQSMRLINEAKAIYGSYNKLSQALGVPWSSIAAITSGRKPVSPALAVLLAEKLARDPLLTVALVSLDADRSDWQRRVWARYARDAAECVEAAVTSGLAGRQMPPRARAPPSTRPRGRAGRAGG